MSYLFQECLWHAVMSHEAVQSAGPLIPVKSAVSISIWIILAAAALALLVYVAAKVIERRNPHWQVP
jgi:hypothetical protein